MNKQAIMAQIDRKLEIIKLGPSTFQINMDGEYANVTRSVMEYIRKLHYTIAVIKKNYEDAEEFGNKYYDLYRKMVD